MTDSRSLRDYQYSGVSYLISNSSAVLADDMGLGKTVQVASALSELFKADVTSKALIVAPRALVQNWHDELLRWAPELAVRVVTGSRSNREAAYLLPIAIIIATYDQVRIDRALFRYGEQYEVVVLDEAQRIKSPTSSTSIACTTLPRRRSWALTGTPLENSPLDLVALYSFVRPGLLAAGMSATEMQELIKPHFLRRTKTEVLPELPRIIFQEIPLELAGQQKEQYDAIWSARAASGKSDPPRENMFALISKLKQQCNFDRASGESVKLEVLEIALDNLKNDADKVIIFSQYTETLSWLSKRLGIAHDMYHGGMSNKRRESALQRFRQQNGPRALLMSLRAGGVGLNLQEASMVVLFDRWWNPSVENQAIHRAHRFGRERPLHVLRFLVRHSIEERIERLLRYKQHLFECYIDEAESADLSQLNGIVLQELLK